VSTSPSSTLIATLGRAGRPGREAAVRLDLLRSIGMRAARQRRQDDARHARLVTNGMRPGYKQLWAAAAEQVGAQLVDLSGGFLEIRRNGSTARVWNNWVALDDAVTLKLAGQKSLVHHLLTSAGLPVPEHTSYDAGDLRPALEFLRRTGGPCVVKPGSAAGGSGITSGIRTPAHLRRATLRAHRLYRELQIERQVPGDVYRFLFLEGQLIDVIRRLAPRVQGDGRSTIAQLVAAENDRRFAAAAGERPWLLRLDLDAVLTLEHAGLTVSSIPAAGESVAVKTAISQNGPDDNEGVLDEVSDELVADATRAVELVGVRLAGVDLITPDPRVSLVRAGGAILEVNGTPGLHYHYDVRDRERAVPVAVPILRRLLGESAA
jgi:D-alanine-D-alanine ligase-like ATP-grasp enzyme